MDLHAAAARHATTVVLQADPVRGRTLRAARDIAAGEVLFTEDAALFAVAAAAGGAGSVPGLAVFGKCWAAPAGRDECAARAAVMQLHPEQRPFDGGGLGPGAWEQQQSDSDDGAGDYADGDAPPPLATVRQLWAARLRISPTARPGAASRSARRLLAALWREYNSDGPAARPQPRGAAAGGPNAADRAAAAWATRLTDGLASEDDADLHAWLALRLVAPLNQVGCECGVPPGDARALLAGLRARVTDAELADAGLDPAALFAPLHPGGAAGASDGDGASAKSASSSSPPPEPPPPTVPVGLTGLFVLVSMLSHDCRPSCYFRSQWSAQGACPQVTIAALRPIAAGEELTISYVGDGPESTHVRRAKLRPYGFTCACARCAAPGDDTVVFACCDACGGCGRVLGPAAAAAAGGDGGNGIDGAASSAAPATCADCGAPAPGVPRLLTLRSALHARLAAGEFDDGDEAANAAALQEAVSAAQLHPTDAVRVTAQQARWRELRQARQYGTARAAAEEVAAALAAVPWGSFRRRFYALCDAGDAAGLAGDPPAAGAHFAAAVAAVVPYATDTATPHLAGVLPLLAAAAADPPSTPAAARTLRRARLRLEDELEDGNY
jgi:hypothetical protein